MKIKVKWLLLGAAALCAVLLALCFGGARLSLTEVWAGLRGSGGPTLTAIMRHVRLPRVLGAVLAGVGLSVSGALLQSVTNNALASPNIIGVNAGAGFATILLLHFFPTAVPAQPFAAFAGAFAATMCILGIAGRMDASKTAVLLAGMALTTLLNAGISCISLLDTDVLSTYNDFSIGGLAGVTPDRLLIPAILILLSLGLALLLSGRIATLCLGDELAGALGVRVRGLRVVCLLCASASAAAVVSFAGLLGFVGLIVPHMARRLCGSDVRRSLPAAALLGAALVPLADVLGRALFAPTELPVGIVMAAVGAPFFLILLLRRKRHA